MDLTFKTSILIDRSVSNSKSDKAYRGRGYEVKKWTYFQKLLAPPFLDVILHLKKLSKIFF